MASRSAALHERTRAVIPGGISSAQRSIAGLEDLVIASTERAYFTDADGKRYLDSHAASGPPVLGHADPDVGRAIAETARTVDLMGVGVTEQEIVLDEIRHRPARGDTRSCGAVRAHAVAHQMSRGELP